MNVSKTSFHVIAISESWLDETTNLNDFHLANYDIVHTNRLNKRGVGVLLYVNKKLNHVKLDKYSTVQDDLLECVTMEIYLENCKKYTIMHIQIYRVRRLKKFNGHMEQFMNSFKSNKTLYMCGISI